MSKAYLIDVRARLVRVVEVTDLSSKQVFVGGYIEVAHHWHTGDVLYVDEHGLYKPKDGAFVLVPERLDQAIMGNGLLVGKEIGETDRTKPPTMALDKLIGKIQFLTFAEGQAYNRARGVG